MPGPKKTDADTVIALRQIEGKARELAAWIEREKPKLVHGYSARLRSELGRVDLVIDEAWEAVPTPEEKESVP